MHNIHHVGKREFIQHTSKYLKMAEQEELIITHQGAPALKIVPLRFKSIKDLKQIVTMKVLESDINTPILPGYEEW